MTREKIKSFYTLLKKKKKQRKKQKKVPTCSMLIENGPRDWQFGQAPTLTSSDDVCGSGPITYPHFKQSNFTILSWGNTAVRRVTTPWTRMRPFKWTCLWFHQGKEWKKKRGHTGYTWGKKNIPKINIWRTHLHETNSRCFKDKVDTKEKKELQTEYHAKSRWWEDRWYGHEFLD